MKHFDVIVCHYRVQIQEVEEPHKTVHVRAMVDGENYVYRITKYSGHKLHRPWSKRLLEVHRLPQRLPVQIHLMNHLE